MKYSTVAIKRALFAGVALWIAMGQAEAGVVLNAPDVSGFYDANIYSPEAIGLPQIGPVFSAALPSVNGFAGQKIWGTATLGPDVWAPYIIGTASGTASGTLLQDTNFYIKYEFDSPNIPDVDWFLQASIQTDNGSYYAEFSFPSDVNGHTVSGLTALAKNGVDIFVPAGTEVLGWQIQIFLGELGLPPGTGSITLNIPDHSLDLIAVNAGSVPDAGPSTDPAAVPEPSTWMMLGAGVSLMAAGKLRRRSR